MWGGDVRNKEHANRKAREAYRARVSTEEGKQSHRDKVRMWRASKRPDGWVPKNKPPNYWSKEACAAEAAKHLTRFEFQIVSSSAYTTAVRNGWLSEMCAHMGPPNASRVKWTFGACAGEARKYASRAQFHANNPRAYNAASKKGWLEDVCAHMPYPTNRLKEDVAALASAYETRSAFARHENAAYVAAQRRGWLDDVCAHMGPPEKMKLFTRFVYVIRAGGTRDVYVGLSCDPKKRYGRHAVKGRAEVRDMLSRPHRFLVVTTRLAPDAAADYEKRLIARFRDAGWNVINVLPGGGLGAAYAKWTPETIKIEAEKYDSVASFRSGARSAYGKACRLGIVDDVCAHMARGKRPNGYWTEETVRAEIAGAKTRAEASKGRFRMAYRYAQMMGILSDVLSHLPRRNRMRTTMFDG